jgi:hypothetical protein
MDLTPRRSSIMPHYYYNTGNKVPSTGLYSSFCDNAVQLLNKGDIFPPCPTCHLAASWRPS